MKKKNQDMLKIADLIVKELKSAGFIIQRLDAVTTNSIYLKLDYGVCHSLRISDHPGKNHLHYRYNLMTTHFHTSVKRERTSKGDRNYYPMNHIKTMIDEIIQAREAKVAENGLRLYRSLMNMNRNQNLNNEQGFWQSCREV